MMLYMLYGEDDFSLHEELENIKEGLTDGELLAFNTTVLEGQGLSLEQLMSVCNALPFLAPKRLVIVQGLLSRFEPRDRPRYGEGLSNSAEPRKEEAQWLALGERVQGIADSTVLVLIDGGLRKDNPLLKLLSSRATVKESPLLRGDRLKHWLRLRGGEKGSSMSPSATSLLADLTGSNLWLLSSEIEKLGL